jgi:hypothetical protein
VKGDTARPRYPASSAFTIPATTLPSARPAVFGPIAFMT